MRPFHCTSVWLTPVITPNGGNSTSVIFGSGGLRSRGPLSSSLNRFLQLTTATMLLWFVNLESCLISFDQIDPMFKPMEFYL